MKPMNRPREYEPDPATTKGQFALYLRHLMEKRGLTAGDLGEKCGVSRATIFHWLAAKRTPNVEQLEPLAEALGLSDWGKLSPPESFVSKISG